MHKFNCKSTFTTVLFLKFFTNYSANNRPTAAWINLLKDFNSGKYIHIINISLDFNSSTDVPSIGMNPTGSGNNE